MRLGDGSVTKSLGDIERRREMWHAICDWLLNVPDEERQAFLSDLSGQLGVALPAQAPAGFRAMNWQQLAEAVAAGISVGSHSCSHIPLARESLERQVAEASASRRRLEQELGIQVRHFSYPHGRREDVSADTIEAVRRAGYSSAVLGYADLHPMESIWTLRRSSPPESLIELQNLLSGLPLVGANRNYGGA